MDGEAADLAQNCMELEPGEAAHHAENGMDNKEGEAAPDRAQNQVTRRRVETLNSCNRGNRRHLCRNTQLSYLN